ncbi:MAG: YdcF family protein [Nocardioides sp.]|uniref:YdcF family protein n=1 Tax=Nocardioides sp. TaxID=35761 RepID=UPI003F013DA1
MDDAVWFTWTLFALGVGVVTLGVVGFLLERRRLSNSVLVLLGLALAFPTLLVLTSNDDGSARTWQVLVLLAVVALPLLGYPVLALFLVANGVAMWRRESRSLGNLLSGLAGLGMIGLVVVLALLGWVEPGSSTAEIVVVATDVFLVGAAAYLGSCFLVFLVSALAYRRVPRSFRASHVIVLGSGLIGSRVPPLLAARLDKAVEVAAAQDPPAVIIPSGGQGADEDVAEGVAMAEHLRSRGVEPERILVEDRARTTRENLLLSRALMPDPYAPVLVVTTSYHVFRTALLTRQLGMDARVHGARTAAYYVPSAFLREWVAVMRQHLVLHAALVGLWLALVVALTAVSLSPSLGQ